MREREWGGQAGRKEGRPKMFSMFKGRDREVNQQADRQRETNNQLAHSDILRIRTIRDFNAINLLLCIYFIYLLKCTRNGLNNNHNDIPCVCVCVCVRACVRACVRTYIETYPFLPTL